MLCALLTGVFRSVDNHFHDPEVFVENTASLADNAGVRERLFDGFRSEIIAIADGVDLYAETPEEPELAEEITDPDVIVAGEEAIPITDERIERDQAIEEILLDVFDSDDYDTLFGDQLRSVHGQIVRSAELPDEALLRDPGLVSFDARRLYQPIYSALAAEPKTAEITQNEVPAGYGVFDLADRDTTVNAAWWLIENGPGWRGLTYAVAILSFIGAVALAERRPTRVIQFGAGIVGVALVVIVVVFIIRALVPLLAAGSGGDAAVSAVYAANTSSLVSTMIRLCVVGIVLVVVGWGTRLVWPDDWVYGHVADDRGVRSIRRRRSAEAPQPQPQVQSPAAAPVPTPYPGYPPQHYGYPPPGYAPAQYPMPYPPQYPMGPYAQPVPGGYATGPGATVPVVPGGPSTPGVVSGQTPTSGESAITGEHLPQGSESLPRPSDAAGAVPRVVASAKRDSGSTRSSRKTARDNGLDEGLDEGLDSGHDDGRDDDTGTDEIGEPTAQHGWDYDSDW